MSNCNPCRTPAELIHKLDSTGPPVADPTLFRSLAGTAPSCSQAHLEIYTRHTRSWSSDSHLPHHIISSLLRRRLGGGGVSSFTTVHIRLLRFPRGKPHLLVIQTPRNDLEIKCRSRISGSCKHNCGDIMASQSPSRAPLSHNKGHHCLL